MVAASTSQYLPKQGRDQSVESFSRSQERFFMGNNNPASDYYDIKSPVGGNRLPSLSRHKSTSPVRNPDTNPYHFPEIKKHSPGGGHHNVKPIVKPGGEENTFSGVCNHSGACLLYTSRCV